MILSPLQNTVNILGQQKKPFVTQHFGEHPDWYKKFGHLGHNGLDFRAPVGTPIFSPINGELRAFDTGSKGYGLYVVIQNQRLKVILAHLSSTGASVNQPSYFVRIGDIIGNTGNSGNSTAPHLHMTLKKMNGPQVADKNNGFGGAFDFEPFLICWRGTISNDQL